jgi:DNA modification methylase
MRDERRHNDVDEKKRAYFHKYDLGKLQEIDAREIPHWHPSAPMIKGRETCIKRNLAAQGVNTVADLFTRRNLWALATIRAHIDRIDDYRLRDGLLFSFTSILLKSSKLMAHNNDGIGRIQKGTYYIPQLMHDINARRFLEEAVADMAIGYAAIGSLSSLCIETCSATSLDLPDNSIDYIFTDPPYADKVQYGELNFIWECWLKFDINWHSEEIIINAARGKTEADWARMMRTAIAECYRVLKPGRALSLCYHDTSAGTWELMQDIMSETGFIAEPTTTALYIDTKTKTTNQYFADKVNRRDLVINFRKPKSNSCLRAYAEAHVRAHPYNAATDCYQTPAFTRPIETTKATAIYNMHSYWSKKPHDAIRQYIQHYTQVGDLVLDPFCGSGGTALAALLEARKAIAIDRSPAAAFITANYCADVDVKLLKSAFEQLQQEIKSEIDWLYQTRCQRCDGIAETAYTVYSQLFQCSRCLMKVALFDCPIENNNGKQARVCPHCQARGQRQTIDARRDEKCGAMPVLVSYICQNGCQPMRDERRHNDVDEKKRAYFHKYDLGKLKEIDAREIPYWYPRQAMMNIADAQQCWGEKWRAGTSNFRNVSELFTRRNLWAIAAILQAIKKLPIAQSCREALIFGITGIIFGLSRMNRYVPYASFPFYVMMGTYYLPQIHCDEPVFHHFANKIARLIKGYQAINLSNRDLIVATANAADLNAIPDNSIDYIFTDPPYADKVQYGELNFVWEAWLGLDTAWHNEEIIVNAVRGKSAAGWARMMKDALAECYRVLKPGRWLSLCYHDSSAGSWEIIQEIIRAVGFQSDCADSAIFIDTGQKSYNQITADKVNRRDLVINFQKPKETGSHYHAIALSNDRLTFREQAHRIIRDYLRMNPGANKDRIYDELISHMVRAGQMQAHDFDELLREVAQAERCEFDAHSRWYLKESEAALPDRAESAREAAAARAIGDFIAQRLMQDTAQEGVHYSDIFEHYICAVKEKPRRSLQDWLADYFYRAENGNWRLPISSAEEEWKAAQRAAGINRQIKRYVALLDAGAAISTLRRPDSATLIDWLHQARKNGLYEAGKLLYERGQLDLSQLTEAAVVNIEEDYQICLRALRATDVK